MITPPTIEDKLVRFRRFWQRARTDRLCAPYDQDLGDQIHAASAFRGVP